MFPKPGLTWGSPRFRLGTPKIHDFQRFLLYKRPNFRSSPAPTDELNININHRNRISITPRQFIISITVDRSKWITLAFRKVTFTNAHTITTLNTHISSKPDCLMNIVRTDIGIIILWLKLLETHMKSRLVWKPVRKPYPVMKIMGKLCEIIIFMNDVKSFIKSGFRRTRIERNYENTCFLKQKTQQTNTKPWCLTTHAMIFFGRKDKHTYTIIILGDPC